LLGEQAILATYSVTIEFLTLANRRISNGKGTFAEGVLRFLDPAEFVDAQKEQSSLSDAL
jgi:hypothetical protein